MYTAPWITALFSPTGGTAAVARGITGGNDTVIDLSVPAVPQVIPGDRVLLAAAPVFGGRIPALALERLAALQGSGPAVALVVYGNRAYEDALLEWKTALEAGGFRVIAAAACIAQHSIAPAVAAGRPDQNDLELAAQFGRQVLEKAALPPEAQATVSVPGSPNYKPFPGMPVHPQADQRCVRCGLCAARCPAGAIPTGDPGATAADRCITCMRCVSICPSHARALPAQAAEATAQRLAQVAGQPRQPEFYL